MEDRAVRPLDFAAAAISRRARAELLACDEYLYTYGEGIVIGEKEASMLVEHRSRVLQSYGRMEFGGGSIATLAKVFCSSPDIEKQAFTEALMTLTEIFYALRNETDGRASDEELANAMREVFDGPCRGSLELLSAVTPAQILRIVNGGESREDYVHE